MLIPVAFEILESLDRAASPAALGATLLRAAAPFGVKTVAIGAIPGKAPPGASMAAGRREQPTHFFTKDVETGETSHVLCHSACDRDRLIARAGPGLLFPAVAQGTSAYGLGFFGPSLSNETPAGGRLASIAYYSFGRIAKLDWTAPAPKLSERQRETLQWAAEGKTDIEIAAILNVSAHTVDKYMRQIKEALNAVNRTAAIVMAMRLGLIS